MSFNLFTKRNDFPESLPTEKTFFCCLCGNAGVEKVKKINNETLYKCKTCGHSSERFLAWDPGMEQYFNGAGELVHKSVGVILENEDKQILLFKRVKFPFLWTIPAGHLDKGEDYLIAAKRELLEETQITFLNCNLSLRVKFVAIAVLAGRIFIFGMRT